MRSRIVHNAKSVSRDLTEASRFPEKGWRRRWRTMPVIRTSRLYGRRREELSLDEVERTRM
jgi:hypothetical protein